MAVNYIPQNFENGKTVLTAEHLDQIERGITNLVTEVNGHIVNHPNGGSYNDTELRGLIRGNKDKIDGMVVSYTDEDIEVEYPTLETDLENVVSEVARVSTELEHVVNVNETEYDFVELVKNKTNYDGMYIKKENSLGWITVYLTQGNKHLSWSIRNNAFDDFMILGDCFSGAIENIEAISDNKNYENITGTWSTTAPNAHFTSQVGATFDVKFTGNKVDFKHYADNRGGIWEFEIIELPSLGKKTITTFSTSVLAPKTQTLFDSLDNGTYTLKGTFKGDDPNNAPSGGAGTSRGWVYVNGLNDALTIRSYLKYKGNKREVDHLVGFSNKEFAFNIKEINNFVPMHNGVGTAFNVEPPIIQADSEDLLVDSLTYPKKINSLNITQSCYGRLNDGENYLKTTIYTTIKSNGVVGIEGKLEVLKNCTCNYGYFLMFPIVGSATDRLVSSFGNIYPSTKIDGTKSYISKHDTDNSKTYMFLKNNNSNVMAIRYNNFEMTTRKNDASKESEPLFIEHRDATMQKLYHRVFWNRPLQVGDVYRWSGDFIVANLKGFEKLFR